MCGLEQIANGGDDIHVGIDQIELLRIPRIDNKMDGFIRIGISEGRQVFSRLRYHIPESCRKGYGFHLRKDSRQGSQRVGIQGIEMVPVPSERLYLGPQCTE